MTERDEWPELPEHAFSDSRASEINDAWFEKATFEEQTAAMEHWFLARFCDPAEETPYMSSEGGYIWIHGGPYDASEQIEGRFSHLAIEGAIEVSVANVQNLNGVYDWAPTALTYLDETDDVPIDDRNEPTRRLEDRIQDVLTVLDLKGPTEAVNTARNLAYAAVISALEAFLHETMSFWVSSRDDVVKRIVTEHPKFKDQSIRLGAIYDTHASLGKQVKSHLRRLVWHREGDVVALFKHGFDVELKFHRFKDEILIRHDIVHRFSHNGSGGPIAIESEQVRALSVKVVGFANEIDAAIVKFMDDKKVD
jgi:hypothetical protein